MQTSSGIKGHGPSASAISCMEYVELKCKIKNRPVTFFKTRAQKCPVIGRHVENIGDELASLLEKFCNNHKGPEYELEGCELCPGHCVKSKWSPWSQCKDVSNLLDLICYNTAINYMAHIEYKDRKIFL